MVDSQNCDNGLSTSIPITPMKVFLDSAGWAVDMQVEKCWPVLLKEDYPKFC